MPTKPKPAPRPALTRVRLDVTPEQHLHLRMEAAKINLSMAGYVNRLVQQDMKRTKPAHP